MRTPPTCSRYVFGATGTKARLYVNPAAAEPVQADAVSTKAASTAPAYICSVALRQGSNQSPLLLDGLRVATTYALARPAAGAPLPVTLVAFAARYASAASVRLTWSTAQEVNAPSFQVQRATDARNFVTVATLPAAGTSSGPAATPPSIPRPLRP